MFRLTELSRTYDQQRKAPVEFGVRFPRRAAELNGKLGDRAILNLDGLGATLLGGILADPIERHYGLSSYAPEVYALVAGLAVLFTVQAGQRFYQRFNK